MKNGQIFKNKNILVTGGTGSIGSQIVRELIPYKPKAIRVLSNDENGLFSLQQDIGSKRLRYLVGDIRDKGRIIKATENIDIIYHCAALKHVPFCEYNPFEAIKTNILGTQNVIEAAFQNDVSKVINVSTDKAVNPINTMGATKLLTEKLITNANEGKGSKKTIFSSVRFGNVIFSRGSIVPLLKEQIAKERAITITDPNMTRYMMKIPDAVRLIFKATEMMNGGEIFILKMPVVRLGDLVDVVVDGHMKREIIGMRQGEKMHEDLITESESEIAIETKTMIIIPKFKARYANAKAYKKTVQKPVSKNEIRKLLK